MKKEVFGKEIVEHIVSACQKISDTVTVTLGPKARNVLLSEIGTNPVITKDGVTVAKFYQDENEIYNAVASILKQSSIETVNRAGDGTTTSMLLANSLLQNCYKTLKENPELNIMDLKYALETLIRKDVEYIKENFVIDVRSKEDIRSIAKISAGGDEMIGDIVAEAVDMVGKAGSILVEESGDADTKLEREEGYKLPSGYASPQFINDKRRNIVKFNKPLILVTDYKIDNLVLDDFKRIISFIDRSQRPAIIIADEVSEDPFKFCLLNAVRKKPIAVINAPRYGQERRELLEDLAVSTGATLVSAKNGMSLSQVELDDLGVCDAIEAGSYLTTFKNGGGDVDLIDERIEQLQSRLAQEVDEIHQERIQKRITALSAGIAIIKTGGFTVQEVTEKKHRVEDALEAVRAAYTSGIVPGGGMVLWRLSKMHEEGRDLDIEKINKAYLTTASKILRETFRAPICKIAENCLKDPETVEELLDVSEVYENFNLGIDFSKLNIEVVNLLEGGVVDPASVLTTALENALSAAMNLLSVEAAIIERH